MKNFVTLLEFLSQFPKADEFSRRSRILLFAYYLRHHQGIVEFKNVDIRRCFEEALQRTPSDLAKILKEMSSGRNPTLLKAKQSKYFGLSIHGLKEVQAALPAEAGLSFSQAPFLEYALPYLRRLLSKVKDRNRRTFLAEAISCLGVNARRATIVMTWLVALDHVYDYVLFKYLNDFNAALQKRTDKASKITVKVKDDFLDLKESVFIEVCRAAGVISNDVRKILDEKLGVRNTCAHPAVVEIHESKVVNFIEDLVDNVIVKYKV